MITVQVTLQDIERGLAKNGTECPIALAVSRTTNLWCRVGQCYLIVSHPEHIVVEYTLPDSAREFISRFDKHAPVEPFTFTMRRMQEAP